MRSRFPVFFVAVLGLVAVLTAQVFGLAMGYQCGCSGRLELTSVDHCHGPHDENCHRDEAPGHQHQEDDGPGERHEHQRVHDEVDSRLAQPSVEVPSWVPMLIAFFGEETLRGAPAIVVSMTQKIAADTGPPGVVVARTTVLLI